MHRTLGRPPPTTLQSRPATNARLPRTPQKMQAGTGTWNGPAPRGYRGTNAAVSNQ